MSADENTALLRRVFEECWSKGNLNLADELLDANYVGHDPALPEETRGPEAFKQLVTTYRTAFPDLNFTLDEALAVGDSSALVRWTARGTNSGVFQGMPPTGKSATSTGMSLARIENGKVVEDYTFWDALGLMRQLGAIPALAQPAMHSTMQTDTGPSAH